jgi:glycosyltransferase involved in cell wall biosynthesis
MRIAIVDPSSRSLPYDYFFLKEIAKSNNVDFYCSYTLFNNHFIKKIEDIENVSTYAIPVSDKNRLVGFCNYLKLLFRIMLNQKRYKSIHFIWSILPIVEIPFFCIFSSKLIFTFHNDVPHNYKKTIFLPYKIIYKLSEKVVFVSKNVMNSFINNYSIKNSKKVLLIKHGIMSLNFESDFDFDFNVNMELEKRIVFWGNVKDYKGVDIFLKLSKNQFFKDYSLEVYGKWDKDLSKLKNAIVKSGVKVVDSFLSMEELAELLDSNSIFILPYEKATQSGVLYTLLFHNRLFISTVTGDNGQFLIEAKLEELLFDKNELDEIIKVVKYCELNQIDIRNKLNKRREYYKWENIFKEIGDIYTF